MHKHGRVEALFLGRRVVVPLVVLLSGEDIGGLHGATFLRAQDTLGVQTSLECEARTIVTDPVSVWNFVDTVTFLVHWDITATAEHNQIFVFVIAVVADGALGVLLHSEASLVSRELLVACIFFEIRLLAF